MKKKWFHISCKQMNSSIIHLCMRILSNNIHVLLVSIWTIRQEPSSWFRSASCSSHSLVNTTLSSSTVRILPTVSILSGSSWKCWSSHCKSSSPFIEKLCSHRNHPNAVSRTWEESDFWGGCSLRARHPYSLTTALTLRYCSRFQMLHWWSAAQINPWKKFRLKIFSLSIRESIVPINRFHSRNV